MWLHVRSGGHTVKISLMALSRVGHVLRRIIDASEIPDLRLPGRCKALSCIGVEFLVVSPIRATGMRSLRDAGTKKDILPAE